MSTSVALITGGAQGIGLAIAEEFRAAGVTTVIADRNLDGALDAARSLGGGSTGHHVDVSDAESINTLFTEVEEAHGAPTILVNNAGVVGSGDSIDMPDETWHREIAVNLTGTFFGCREFARRLRGRHDGGAIVNVSSISGFRATHPEHHLAYDVAKAGVAHLTRVLGAEWAASGIRVNAIGPGYTNTSILQGMGISDPDLVSTWIEQIPQRRLIDPAEIARTVVFLAGDGASAITGQTVMADGGYTL